MNTYVYSSLHVTLGGAVAPSEPLLEAAELDRRADGGAGEAGSEAHVSPSPEILPSLRRLICNSISHNVISLAFTHLADKGNQARCLMKYCLRLIQDLNVLSSDFRTRDRKGTSFPTTCLVDHVLQL